MELKNTVTKMKNLPENFNRVLNIQKKLSASLKTGRLKLTSVSKVKKNTRT